MTKLDYLDFDLQIERTEEGYRAQVVNSPVGQTTIQFSLPFQPLELENFLLRFGRTRHRMRRIDSLEVEAAKVFGARLFTSVFDGAVGDRLRDSLDEARRRNARVRIRLRLVDTPELANLPWEFLYNPAVNRFLALSVNTPLVRYLELPEPVRPLTVVPPLRVLVMISSPSDVVRLDVEREWAILRQALGDLETRKLVALERLDQATLPALQRRLRQHQYHIFHFIGHGGFDKAAQDGVLVLENDHERGQMVSGQHLGTLLHDHDTLRLVVLNACEGARTADDDPFAGVAQSLVQQGIPAVVAMQFEITDDAAITFAHEFYGAVADSYPVDAALTEARKAIFTMGNSLEWGTPVLFMRAPHGRVFDTGTSVPDGDDQGLAERYIKALSAFYTEQWQQAIALFEAIGAQQADYEDAASKLEEAKRQQQLADHYTGGVQAAEAQSWATAISHFQAVQQLDATYKDVAERLEATKRQKTLTGLYVEAQRLHQAHAWQAVINVFERIKSHDRAYPDVDGLLASAREGLAEEERQQKLAVLYNQAVRLVNAGRWAEALTQFEQIQTIDRHYADTEALTERVRRKLAADVTTSQVSKSLMASAVKSIQVTLLHTLTGHTSFVSSVAFASDGQTLASGSGSGIIKLWRVSDGTLLHTLSVKRRIINNLADDIDRIEDMVFAPNGEILATASGNSTINLWRVSDGTLLKSFRKRFNGEMGSVAFAPDGQTLASGSGSGIMKLWRVSDGKFLRTFKESTYIVFSQAVHSMAFAPDGQTLASGSRSKTVKLWRVSDGKLLTELYGYNSRVASVAFAPDGQTLASGSGDGTVQLRRVSDGKLLRTLNAHTYAIDGLVVHSTAFAPDGQTLASGLSNKTVQLWHVSDGRLLYSFTGHSDAVFSVAFAPDGQTLASGSRDKTVKLWKVK